MFLLEPKPPDPGEPCNLLLIGVNSPIPQINPSLSCSSIAIRDIDPFSFGRLYPELVLLPPFERFRQFPTFDFHGICCNFKYYCLAWVVRLGSEIWNPYSSIRSGFCISVFFQFHAMSFVSTHRSPLFRSPISIRAGPLFNEPGAWSIAYCAAVKFICFRFFHPLLHSYWLITSEFDSFTHLSEVVFIIAFVHLASHQVCFSSPSLPIFFLFFTGWFMWLINLAKLVWHETFSLAGFCSGCSCMGLPMVPLSILLCKSYLKGLPFCWGSAVWTCFVFSSKIRMGYCSFVFGKGILWACGFACIHFFVSWVGHFDWELFKVSRKCFLRFDFIILQFVVLCLNCLFQVISPNFFIHPGFLLIIWVVLSVNVHPDYLGCVHLLDIRVYVCVAFTEDCSVSICFAQCGDCPMAPGHIVICLRCTTRDIFFCPWVLLLHLLAFLFSVSFQIALQNIFLCWDIKGSATDFLGYTLLLAWFVSSYWNGSFTYFLSDMVFFQCLFSTLHSSYDEPLLSLQIGFRQHLLGQILLDVPFNTMVALRFLCVAPFLGWKPDTALPPSILNVYDEIIYLSETILFMTLLFPFWEIFVGFAGSFLFVIDVFFNSELIFLVLIVCFCSFCWNRGSWRTARG